MDAFANFYRDKRVLVTGHTGFKGAWLALWLRELGAHVIGYSLDPPTTPSLFAASRLADLVHDERGDVRDYQHLAEIVDGHRPEIIFHLAAQALVRAAYIEPRHTFDVNVMGTVNVLEAARQSESVSLAIVATSDKVYRNTESEVSFSESDVLGGYEPYGVSKACAELVVAAYQDQRFQSAAHSPHPLAIASVRAGNVIGGGDWAANRIVPDLVRAVTSDREIVIRHPRATRPWQHVLDALSGYLSLGPKLMRDPNKFATAWNFGPDSGPSLCVGELADRFLERWPKQNLAIHHEVAAAGEHRTLRVDSTKARQELGWRPAWGIEDTLAATVDWYGSYFRSPEHAREQCLGQIHEYYEAARKAEISWAAKRLDP